jgi:hypothetical protein
MYVSFILISALILCSEQLIPMLGLTPLYKALHPHSTLEKIQFLVENAWAHVHHTTTIISFSALAVLLALRWVKSKFIWIYRLPEVLIVVVVSISKFRFSQVARDFTPSVGFSSLRKISMGRCGHRGPRTYPHRIPLHSLSNQQIEHQVPPKNNVHCCVCIFFPRRLHE